MPEKVRIIGVPMDLGASRRGVDMGPSALRVAGLQPRLKQLGRQVEDIGNIQVRQPEEQPYGEKKARFLGEIAETCKLLAETVKKTLDEDLFPLVLGGDHSIAAGTVAGVAAHFHKESKRIGLIWLDAHGDMNTPETSPSGNIHGMPLAAIMGSGPAELTGLAGFVPIVEPRSVSLVGIRDLDTKERRFAKESGVHVFTMRDIDERGMREVMAEALRFAGDDTAGIAVSLDMDFVDPADAPGVGTPVRGGVTYREAHLALEMIADTRSMVSFELVEVNPVIDLHNTTATLGVELVLSGLGKKIL
ncbi:MAG TPA: arginase [Candidatus Acidoferrales bacterium]|jgi:arginase|nr:arginase [Candidatus Acidoferrales bacterium]HXU49341.1 arginase [Candidatus Binatia bacterium]